MGLELSQRDLSGRDELIFGRARLPNSPLILTKLLARLNPAYRYSNMLADLSDEAFHIVT
jgi:hypothetical protein